LPQVIAASVSGGVSFGLALPGVVSLGLSLVFRASQPREVRHGHPHLRRHDDFLEIGGRVVATPRFSQHAAADGNGAWIVCTHAARLSSRNQAIIALTLAERLAAGYGDDDPFVVGWRKELFL
jgi:hypothetical protein